LIGIESLAVPYGRRMALSRTAPVAAGLFKPAP